MDRDGLFVIGGLAFGFVSMAIVGAVLAFGAALIAFSGDIFDAVLGAFGS
jgi:hypothetical protein